MNIVAASCAVPADKVLPEMAIPVLGEDVVAKIVANTGVRSRRAAQPETTTVDLVVAAAEPLLESLSWKREDIDLLIFVSQTPDYILPASAYIAHKRLGLGEKCLALDISLGCSGFTHAVLTAQGLLDNGTAQRCLLLCGDTITKISSPRDPGTAILFGDAGAAVALESGGSLVRGFSYGSEGEGEDFLKVDAGGFRRPFSEEHLISTAGRDGTERRPLDLRMDGAQIFNFTIRRVPQMIQSALRDADWKSEDVDYYVFHQANAFIINYLRRKLRVEQERVPLSLTEFGNTSCASSLSRW